MFVEKTNKQMFLVTIASPAHHPPIVVKNNGLLVFSMKNWYFIAEILVLFVFLMKNWLFQVKTCQIFVFHMENQYFKGSGVEKQIVHKENQ